MELKDFIKTTLTDIAEAVYEAREKTRGKVAIAPASLEGKFIHEATYIGFDLAVVANETSKKGDNKKMKTKVGINVLGNKVSVGVDGAKEDVTKLETEKISRISFKIPIFFGAVMIEK